ETTSVWGGSAVSPSCARSLLPPGCPARSDRAAPTAQAAGRDRAVGEGERLAGDRGRGPERWLTALEAEEVRPRDGDFTFPPCRSDYTGQGKSTFSTLKHS